MLPAGHLLSGQRSDLTRDVLLQVLSAVKVPLSATVHASAVAAFAKLADWGACDTPRDGNCFITALRSVATARGWALPQGRECFCCRLLHVCRRRLCPCQHCMVSQLTLRVTSSVFLSPRGLPCPRHQACERRHRGCRDGARLWVGDPAHAP